MFVIKQTQFLNYLVCQYCTEENLLKHLKLNFFFSFSPYMYSWCIVAVKQVAIVAPIVYKIYGATAEREEFCRVVSQHILFFLMLLSLVLVLIFTQPDS